VPLNRSALVSATGVAALCLSTTINTAITQELSKQAVEAQQEQNRLPAMRFGHQIEVLQIAASFQDQCRQLFASVAGERHVEFEHSSNELNSNAFPLLDEIVQIVADCPSAAITITGHTDSSGDERTNQLLSKARADSVFAYMVAKGIAAERLQSRGAGSSAPLSMEDSARARKLNRRIQFEILFPQ
jgi:outer membrane protein OmpA-like peptidoglycan-associated protein